MNLSVTNARMLARAAWGVSVSPPMPRFEEYVASLALPAPRENPGERQLRSAIRARAAASRDAGRAVQFLPWAAGRTIATQRLFAAIVSFVDDYHGPYPDEFFPRSVMAALLAAFASHPPSSLDLLAQFDLALQLVGPHPFAASLALHGATRTLARGRDRRLGAAFDLPLEARLACGASLTPFTRDMGPQGDALGDTYHYWGCFAVGLHCGARGDDPARWLMLSLFDAGADLMAFVRSGVFGHVLFGGTHQAVDRAGLAHGLDAAHVLREAS